MRKYLTVLVAVALLTIPLSVQAEVPCPDPARPIHVMPFCLSESEFMAWTATPQQVIDPGPPWEPLVAKYWPPELVPWALAIIECESNGDPWAKNPRSTAAGLFQFLRSTWDLGPAPALGLPAYWTGAPYVAEWNIQAAAWLYANWGGKSQWTCKA